MIVLIVMASAVVATAGAAFLSLRRLGRSLAQAGHARPVEPGLRGVLRPYRLAVALAVGLEALAVVAGLAAPWPVKAVVDYVTVGRVSVPFGFAGSHHVVLVAVAAGVALVGVLCALDYLSAVLGETIGASASVGIRQSLFAKLVRIPAGSAPQDRNGDLVTRLTTDVSRVQEATFERWRVVVPNGVAMAGMVILMAVLSPVLAAVSAVLAPLVGLAFWLRRRRVSQVQRVARRRSGDLAAQLAEAARSLRATQVFGRGGDECRRLDAAGRTAAVASVQAVATSARLAPVADLLIALNLAVVLALGANQVRAHQLTVGGLVIFLTYLGAMHQPVHAFSRLGRTLGAGLASRERLDTILSAPELPERPDALPLGSAAPVVAAHQVSYAYPDGRPALRDVSLCLPAGQITVISGENGAGKSTLLNLLVRLDDPAGGIITFNGVDARDYDIDSLRNRIGLVPQEVWLTEGTLRENITYGAPLATEEAIQAAARLARVDEFADRLPLGWATPLGEGGAALSGGQRRLVALARALLRDCPMLLLDEPTAGLDADAERLIIETIRCAAVGRTTVIVTHDAGVAALGAHRVTLHDGTASERPDWPVPLATATRPLTMVR
jgi:ABC-type multidrug transport system fused ATPase/permease subunit